MSREQPHDKDAGTWIALMLLLVVSLGLLLLMAMVLPKILWLLLIVIGFGATFALQYFIWGKWLMKHLKERIPDDSEEEEEFLKKYGPQ